MPTQPTKCEIIFTGLKKLLVTGMKRQKIGGERFERGLGLREAATAPSRKRKVKRRPGVYGVPQPEPPVKAVPKKVIAKSSKEADTRKKRIVWTQEESNAVAEAMFLLWEKDPAAGFTGDICERAMHDALPSDRRRVFAGLSQSPGILEALNSRIRKALGHPAVAPVAVVAPSPVEPPPPVPERTPVNHCSIRKYNPTESTFRRV